MMFAQSGETTTAKPPGSEQTQRYREASPLPSASNWLVSLATAPVLLAIVGSRALSEFSQQLGLASEELFRGDRLPVLSRSNLEAKDDEQLKPE
ncbi:hypothetical protein [Almyronema epifaneia]|uniref:Uncharacterized protein n=1 Tax=Almyronema epifaneia S1 TaxID=2991925 RepID=A0ABW6IIU4_9CYAN